VYLRDDLRLSEVQEIRVALDVPVVVRESLASERFFGQSSTLEQHTPSTVEHDDTLGKESFEAGARIHGATLVE